VARAGAVQGLHPAGASAGPRHKLRAARGKTQFGAAVGGAISAGPVRAAPKL